MGMADLENLVLVYWCKKQEATQFTQKNSPCYELIVPAATPNSSMVFYYSNLLWSECLCPSNIHVLNPSPHVMVLGGTFWEVMKVEPP